MPINYIIVALFLLVLYLLATSNVTVDIKFHPKSPSVGILLGLDPDTGELYGLLTLLMVTTDWSIRPA
jgi:hypothetical protein